MNEIRAFVLAPLPAAVAGAFVSQTIGASPHLLSIVIFYVLSLYIAQSLIGYPILNFLQQKGKTGTAHFALGGAAMVALPAVPYLAWAMARQSYALSEIVALLALWTVLGGITGATYRHLTKPTPFDPRAWLTNLLGPRRKYLPAPKPPLERHAAELLALGNAEDASAHALWAELVREADHLVASVVPEAFCKVRLSDRSLGCMIRRPDGKMIGETVHLKDLTETRLLAVGGRLKRYAVMPRMSRPTEA